MSSTLEQAGAIVGVVILYHNSPLPIPNEKPFNCVICISSWIALCGLPLDLCVFDALTRVGLAALIAGLVTFTTPQLFRQFPQ